MQFVFFKSGSHKYVRRQGSAGNYRYWYKDPQTGEVYEGDESGKKKADTSSEKKIGDLTKKADGWWYRGEAKITRDDKKAEEFAKKTTKKEDSKPEIKIGATVRVKPGATTREGHKIRGAIAKIKEVGADFVRLIDESGNMWRVNTMALETAKSMESDFDLNLIKAIQGSMKSGHKYWKRTGTTKRYRYWYKDASGKIIEGKQPVLGKNKTDKQVTKRLRVITQTQKEMAIAGVPMKERKNIVRRSFEFKKEKPSFHQMKLQLKKVKSIPELPVAAALQSELQLRTQKQAIESKRREMNEHPSDIDQQKLIDEKNKVQMIAKDTGKGKSKLAFIQKQIDESEKKKTPQEKMMIALRAETGKDKPKLLGYNLRTITKQQLEKIKSSERLRNQFIIENQALVNDVAARAVKHWKDHVFDYATFDDAKQDAQIGLLVALKKFNPKKNPMAMFLNYTRKVMTQKMNREMQIRMTRKINETSIYDEVPTKKEGAPLTIADTLKETRDAFAYERETGIITKMVDELSANGKAEKNKRAIQVLRALAQGWKPAHIAEALHVSRGQVAKLIQRKVLPIVNKYLVKSKSFASFVAMLKSFVEKYQDKK